MHLFFALNAMYLCSVEIICFFLNRLDIGYLIRRIFLVLEASKLVCNEIYLILFFSFSERKFFFF